MSTPSSLPADIKASSAIQMAQQIHTNKGGKFDLDLTEVLLLDSESTASIFCNKKFAKGIHKVADSITIKSNGGEMKANHK